MIAFLWWRVLAFFLAKYELILAPDGSPYLARWHFPAWVASRFGASQMFLHYFYQSDPDRGGWHSHPWIWCESEILTGAYVQAIPQFWLGEWRPAYKTFRAGDRNRLTNERHAVALIKSPVWTLSRAGPKHGRSWGFVDHTGRTWPANGNGATH